MDGRDRFILLDGLRGVAAVAVLLYHLHHWDGGPELFARGYLAVDLFFCLSGFVLAHAYGARLASGEMGFGAFLLARLVRLWPMIALSALLYALYLTAKSAMGVEPVPLGAVLRALVSGLALVPWFDAPAIVGGPEVFPINGPLWSLWLELWANLLWAPLILVLTPYRMIAVVAASAALLGAAWALHGQPLHGNLSGTALWGAPRVVLSFLLGVLIHRARGAQRPSPLGAALLIALALGAMALPLGLGPAPDMVFVLVVSPLIVAWGARVAVTGATAIRACAALGAVSYPLYLLHFPLFAWINGTLEVAGLEGPGAPRQLAMAAAIIALSALCLRLYDAPMRAWARRRLRGARPAGGAAGRPSAPQPRA